MSLVQKRDIRFFKDVLKFLKDQVDLTSTGKSEVHVWVCSLSSDVGMFLVFSGVFISHNNRNTTLEIQGISSDVYIRFMDVLPGSSDVTEFASDEFLHTRKRQIKVTSEVKHFCTKNIKCDLPTLKMPKNLLNRHHRGRHCVLCPPSCC
jgi:hypothetical protein